MSVINPLTVSPTVGHTISFGRGNAEENQRPLRLELVQTDNDKSNEKAHILMIFFCHVRWSSYRVNIISERHCAVGNVVMSTRNRSCNQLMSLPHYMLYILVENGKGRGENFMPLCRMKCKVRSIGRDVHLQVSDMVLLFNIVHTKVDWRERESEH